MGCLKGQLGGAGWELPFKNLGSPGKLPRPGLGRPGLAREGHAYAVYTGLHLQGPEARLCHLGNAKH